NGSGSFKAMVSDMTGGSGNAMAGADLNGDGVTDVVTVRNATPPQYIFLTNTTSMTFARGSHYTPPTFTLATQSGALSALSTLSTALANLETARGTFGAWQSRIEKAVSSLTNTTTQYEAARGRIVDADIAQESAQLVRTSILQQAASAVLA